MNEVGKVLVTGGTGFIGRRLVERLLQQGQKVRLLVRPASAQKSLPEGVDVAWGDVTDQRAVREAMQGCAGVFHLAALAKPWARDPGDFAAVNVLGTRHVMAAALGEGVERVVHTSSMVTFGPSDGTVADEEQARSHQHFYSHYEHTKWLGELEVGRFVEKGLSAVIVNPTVVLGPSYPLPRNGLWARSYRFISGGIPGAFGSRIGRPGRLSNMVYIEDLVEGHLLAMDRGRTGEKYILGGDNVSSQDYLKLAQEIGRLPLGRLRLPVGPLEMLGQVEEARARLWGGPPLITHSMGAYRHDWAFSCRKAQEELGYRYRGFRQAVQGMMGLPSEVR